MGLPHHIVSPEFESRLKLLVMARRLGLFAIQQAEIMSGKQEIRIQLQRHFIELNSSRAISSNLPDSTQRVAGFSPVTSEYISRGARLSSLSLYVAFGPSLRTVLIGSLLLLEDTNGTPIILLGSFVAAQALMKDSEVVMQVRVIRRRYNRALIFTLCSRKVAAFHIGQREIVPWERQIRGSRSRLIERSRWLGRIPRFPI